MAQEIEQLEKEIRGKQLAVQSSQESLQLLTKKLDAISDREIALNVTISNNSSNKLLEDTKRRLSELEHEIDSAKNEEAELRKQTELLRAYAVSLKTISYHLLGGEEISLLTSSEKTVDKKRLLERIEQFQSKELEEIQSIHAQCKLEMQGLSERITGLQERLKNLEKHTLQFPENTVELRSAIEKEFQKRGISSKPYILAELLEITDERWINAVEGYFNKQKFYLIVEPQYYDIALEVYDKERKRIHTAGIINTKKLPLEKETLENSLADVVRSENRYAKAYANYLLGRVVRCESSKDLENFDIAITPHCMLYQGFVVRHLDPQSYRDPYIGQYAYRTQIVNVKKELEELSAKRSVLREKTQGYASVLEAEKKFALPYLKLYVNAPVKKKELLDMHVQVKTELDKASKDPTLIQLQLDLADCNKEKKELEQEKDRLNRENNRLLYQIEDSENQVNQKRELKGSGDTQLIKLQDENGLAYYEAQEKYAQNRKSKSPATIAENFAPQRTQFENEKSYLTGQLMQAQSRFNMDFTQDFVIGLSGISEYREYARKLQSVEIIRYEERLRKAKEDCEQIFRSDFLSKMKELIESAKLEFRNLNKALDSIYYGDDSYHFKITFDKKKEGLYRMITAETNMEGINLWTAAFEEQYREEMSDLFDKLMTKDDKGQKIVEEYTDYRSYLDYDIEIHKRDGSVQRFSDIYGEKSGSETQVPYYVAIAASFYQLYRYGNSVRLMLLDEAFDKMDDERIASMLDFFNGLNLQVIMATPPAKIETIGEKVDTVLACIRMGQSSIVEEYDL